MKVDVCLQACPRVRRGYILQLCLSHRNVCSPAFFFLYLMFIHLFLKLNCFWKLSCCSLGGVRRLEIDIAKVPAKLPSE